MVGSAARMGMIRSELSTVLPTARMARDSGWSHFVSALPTAGRSLQRRASVLRSSGWALPSAPRQASVGPEANECFARPAVAELTIPMATFRSHRLTRATCTRRTAQARSKSAPLFAGGICAPLKGRAGAAWSAGGWPSFRPARRVRGRGL